MKVRDKLWMFGCRAHDDDIFIGRSDDIRWRWSRITPAEGALMLDIPNMLMIVSDGVPAPYSADAYGYMESFCRMDRVLWSAVGSAGSRAGNEENFIVDLAKQYTNVCGAFLDDFYGGYSDDETGRAKHESNLRTIHSIRETLDEAPRRMEIWVTLYANEIDMLRPEDFADIDAVTVWTWSQDDLHLLPGRLHKISRLLPGKKILQGVYFYDYPSYRAVSQENMEFQCEYGLREIRDGRLDGMLFCDNCVMGAGLKSEYWLRNWIGRVKNMEL